MGDSDDPRGKRRMLGIVLMGPALMMGVLAVLAYSGVFEGTSDAGRTIATVLGAVAVVDFAMALYFLTSNPS